MVEPGTGHAIDNGSTRTNNQFESESGCRDKRNEKEQAWLRYRTASRADTSTRSATRNTAVMSR